MTGGACSTAGEPAIEIQHVAIGERVFVLGDRDLQDALAEIHGTEHRPRCICVQGGVEMYVAHYAEYLVKRMPGSGPRHSPSCPCYEPEPTQSGLGELLGRAIIEHSPESVELRVDFPLTRAPGRGSGRREARETTDVRATASRMSLRAVMHFLFERAGFNRWFPSLKGKRSQAVLHRYLLEAAEGVVLKGLALSERLYVPEQFHEARKEEVAARRRAKLAILHHPDDDRQFRLALVIGEYKKSEASAFGRRVWLRHMPDVPLFIDQQAWQRLERVYGSVLEAPNADLPIRLRVVIGCLVYARHEHVYQIDSASLLLATDDWIPIADVGEAGLVHALTEQSRHFIKPLRYDARYVAAFPCALLLDTGERPTPLHILGAFLDAKERADKERAIAALVEPAWVWHTERPMPCLPRRRALHALRRSDTGL